MKPINKCPLCGSRKVQRVCEAVELHPRGRRVVVPDVEFDHCFNCGEKFFDHSACEKMDSVVFSSKRRWSV
jgi:YgiT-type zinc finger domain-containing protein